MQQEFDFSGRINPTVNDATMPRDINELTEPSINKDNSELTVLQQEQDHSNENNNGTSYSHGFKVAGRATCTS